MNKRKRLGRLSMLLIPALVLVLVFNLFPLLWNLILSLFDKHAFANTQEFVGFSNYRKVISDEDFWISFKNGIVYSIFSVFGQIILGLIAALLLNERFKGRMLFSGIMLFPYLLPTVLVVILWKWLLNSSYGLVNQVLQGLNIIDNPIIWFSENNIMFTTIFVSIWQFFPFAFVMLFARLQAIPVELYRSAEIDGSNRVQKFIHVTLPQLKQVTIAIILIRSIWMFTKFDTVWLLSGQGSIGKYIETLPVYAYRQTFSYLRVGVGATVAVILMIIVGIGALIYVKSFLKVNTKLNKI